MNSEAKLAALLDTLIPGDESYPAPSAIGLSERLIAHRRFGSLTGPVLERLPEDFDALDNDRRAAAVAAVEADSGPAFSALLLGLYSLYYTDPLVLAVIARESGYTPRAPQPDGYALPPFDPASVTVPASRAPHYRSAGGSLDE